MFESSQDKFTEVIGSLISFSQPITVFTLKTLVRLSVGNGMLLLVQWNPAIRPPR